MKTYILSSPSPLLVYLILIIVSLGLVSPSSAQTASLSGIITLSNTPSNNTSPRMKGRYGRPTASNKESNKPSPILIFIEKEGHQHTASSQEKIILNQRDLQFSPSLTVIYEGEEVRILNSDPVYHNVFSLSKTKSFDVGRRPTGSYKDVSFEQVGNVEVFCDIHSSMNAQIKVIPLSTYIWDIVEPNIPFNFSSLPKGNYRLWVYAPGFVEQSFSISLAEDEQYTLARITLQP